MSDLKKRLLSDLGKATRRGVRRCPQCGTINGTRGLSCKNSLCDMVFKEIIEKPRRVNLDACKLITEQNASSCLPSWTTLFSVRVKERCPDHYRGFVQIELEDMNHKSEETCNPILLQLESVELTPTKGTCYVLGCPKRTVATKITNGEEVCHHIAACITRSDLTESEPFTLKHSVLNSLSISTECKQKIFIKARDGGPLVQRVSPTTMVVKCDKDDFLHPLGYLHTSFLKTNQSNPGSDFKFGCSCSLNSGSIGGNSKKKNPSILSLNMSELHSSNTPVMKDRCLHFYSCIAAFCGDSQLAKEFSRFISDEQVVSSMQQVIAILGEDDNNIKVEVMDEDNLDLFPNTATGAGNAAGNPKADDLEHTFDGINIPEEAGTDEDSLGKHEMETIFHQQTHQLSPNSMSVALYGNFSPLEWLASITEQINVTMHYGFPDRPEPLIFQVPMAYFNFLMDRISAGTQKKRLPNTTQSIVRSNKPPLGQFTKYTWLLTNIFQLKKVFDTPLVHLDVSRKFVRNPDGSYSLQPNKLPLNEIEAEELVVGKFDNSKKTNGKQMKHLRPVEYKTFLKVGQMSSNPRDVTPFTIEWVPDLLPRSRIGELTIKFEFGHQLNGQLDPSMQPKNVT